MTDTQKELHAGTFHIAFWKSIPLEFIRKEDGQGGYVIQRRTNPRSGRVRHDRA